MDKKPSNKLIAEQSGLTEDQVGSYLTEVVEQPDGGWLAHFGHEISRLPEAASKLDQSLSLRIPEWLAKHWFDRDNV